MSAEQGAPPFLRLFTRYLKDRGLPITQQRQAVAEVIFEADGHLSVDEIEGGWRNAISARASSATRIGSPARHFTST